MNLVPFNQLVLVLNENATACVCTRSTLYIEMTDAKDCGISHKSPVIFDVLFNVQTRCGGSEEACSGKNQLILVMSFLMIDFLTLP